MTHPDLTVIVNGHREGTLAHHTLRTLHRSLALAAKAGLRIEVIIMLDNADDATRAMFREAGGSEGYLHEVSVPRIIEISVGDLGQARNVGVREAAGEFIAVLDADNLPSRNWFLSAHRTAVSHGGTCVVHPETLVIFEGRSDLWPQWSTEDEVFRAENFYDQNYWDACCLAHREVFEHHPYMPTGGDSGFGPEDWHWNAEVVHAGIPHLAAPGTALFYRAKLVGSLMGAHRAGRSLIHQTPLLTDPEVARQVVSQTQGGEERRAIRRTPLLARLTRQATNKKARQTSDRVPPPPLSKVAETLGRLRPGFVVPAHYRYLYDLHDLSDTETVAHFRAHSGGQRRGWLTSDALAALHPRAFRVDHYRALHHDVVHMTDRASVKLHWLDVGHREGRRARLTRLELKALSLLDLDAYRDRHSDLTDHDDHDLLQHYLEWGLVEGRRATFDIAEHTRNIPIELSASLAAEWRAMHRFEPWVPVPTKAVLSKYHYVGPPSDGSLTAGSEAWWHTVAAFDGARPDVLLFAPWVRLGGGDLLLGHYAKAIAHLRPGAEVVVVTTHGPSTRPDLIDPSIRFVDLTEIDAYTALTPSERQRLVAMLVTQFRPAMVHAFNSPEAFDAVQHYQRSISAHSRIFLSTFTIDLGPDGEIYSHLARRPTDFLEVVERVIVDSHALVEEFHDLYRMDRAKFLPLHQPVDLPAPRAWTARRPGAPLQVLWAARFDRQKRLDVLADVAEATAAAGIEVHWHVYGDPVIASEEESDQAARRLRAQGAEIHGAYRSLEDLPLDDYDLFLMTSEAEGVPNTLLEMMASRLPVMAPMVGGIPEILDATTGWPIEHFDDVGAYVAALAEVAGSRGEAERRANHAYDRLADDFSWEAFHRRLTATPGYLP